MDKIANAVKREMNCIDVGNMYDLKNALININDSVWVESDLSDDAMAFMDATSEIIAKISEDGLSMWKSIEIAQYLNSTEIWNQDSIKGLKNVV